METKELFRATCYMLLNEQKISKIRIQRRFRVNYNEATLIMNLLIENNIVCERKEHTVNFKNINDLEAILDKISYK